MENKRISVGLFCRVLPKYRLGIFERLANRPEIDLTVLYSKEPSYYSLKTVDPDGRFKSELIEMRAWRLGKQEFLYHPDASRLIKSGRFDVVVLPGNPRLLSNFPSLWACRRHRVGVVWWGMARMYNQSKLTYALRKCLMHIPDAVLVYTQKGAESLAVAGIKREKIFVGQNTIDISECTLEASKWTGPRLSHFAAQKDLVGRKVFLYCARLTRVKRLDLLFSALAVILRKDPSVLLVVCGDGEERTKLLNEAAKLGIESHVRWLGSVYDQTELAPWFLSSKALVIPEGVGLAVFQGFAYSLPCVTSNSRAYQSPEWEAIGHGKNGLLYSHRDAKSLGECLELLCSDGELLKKLRKNAFRTVTEEWTCQKMVNGFCEAIRFAYHNRRKSRRDING